MHTSVSTFQQAKDNTVCCPLIDNSSSVNIQTFSEDYLEEHIVMEV